MATQVGAYERALPIDMLENDLVFVRAIEDESDRRPKLGGHLENLESGRRWQQRTQMGLAGDGFHDGAVTGDDRFNTRDILGDEPGGRESPAGSEDDLYSLGRGVRDCLAILRRKLGFTVKKGAVEVYGDKVYGQFWLPLIIQNRSNSRQSYGWGCLEAPKGEAWQP